MVSFQKPAISTLDGKILDSYFLNVISLFKVCFQTAPRMNFGWVDVEEGAWEHHKYMLNSKHPLKNQSFHGSRGYSIYSFVQLS